jgi:two-component system NtrC family response regulator
VAYCAAGDAGVLIQGETGTGKELFARTIHENSPRRDASFVVVDCAALPEHLVESVLFGHVKGAFTGAEQSRDGLVKQADQGTLFLDEVGELPLALQKAFLRVLQEQRFRPVGGQRERKSHFRLISATNRDLLSSAAQGLFRKDLLYRLQTTVINLPPLRERKGDIKLLVLHYIHKFCDRNGMEIKGFVPEFLEVLERYDWPGNVRELINALEHAVLSVNTNPTLYPANLPAELRVRFIRSAAKEKQGNQTSKTILTEDWFMRAMPQDLPPFKEIRDAWLQVFEKTYLIRLMEKATGDMGAAMETSGLSRTKLYALLKKHGVSRR